MGRYKLEAVGQNARELKFVDDSPDLLLWVDKPILLGRAVKEGEGYKYPNAWNSLSSRHCTLEFKPTEVKQWCAAQQHNSSQHDVTDSNRGAAAVQCSFGS